MNQPRKPKKDDEIKETREIKLYNLAPMATRAGQLNFFLEVVSGLLVGI